LFLPDTLNALIHRYQFQKTSTPDELLAGTLQFRQGVFNGVGINEFGMYPDGLVVSTKASTDLLDAFLDDLLQWAKTELGLVEMGVGPRERHYESALIVMLRIETSRAFPWIGKLTTKLKELQAGYGLHPFEFSFNGNSVAIDPLTHVGRQPAPFTIARRVNVPFEADTYYTTAPLKNGRSSRTARGVRGRPQIEPRQPNS
jgi:hypothetical protein